MTYKHSKIYRKWFSEQIPLPPNYTNSGEVYTQDQIQENKQINNLLEKRKKLQFKLQKKRSQAQGLSNELKTPSLTEKERANKHGRLLKYQQEERNIQKTRGSIL